MGVACHPLRILITRRSPGASMPDPQPGDDLEPFPGTPLWVKVGGAVVAALVLLFVVLHLAGGGLGDHGPGGG